MLCAWHWSVHPSFLLASSLSLYYQAEQLLSSYLNPFNTDTSVVQRPIAGQYVVIQGFDQGGLSHYPDLPPGLNTLQQMDAEHGYWIRTVTSQPSAMGGDSTAAEELEDDVDAVVALRVVGERFAEDRPLALDGGWNLVSYLPRTSLPVTVAGGHRRRLLSGDGLR